VKKLVESTSAQLSSVKNVRVCVCVRV
jgi:hypothetical protein